jgi:hypothetical protein
MAHGLNQSSLVKSLIVAVVILSSVSITWAALSWRKSATGLLLATLTLAAIVILTIPLQQSETVMSYPAPYSYEKKLDRHIPHRRASSRAPFVLAAHPHKSEARLQPGINKNMLLQSKTHSTKGYNGIPYTPRFADSIVEVKDTRPSSAALPELHGGRMWMAKNDPERAQLGIASGYDDDHGMPLPLGGMDISRDSSISTAFLQREDELSVPTPSVNDLAVADPHLRGFRMGAPTDESKAAVMQFMLGQEVQVPPPAEFAIENTMFHAGVEANAEDAERVQFPQFFTEDGLSERQQQLAAIHAAIGEGGEYSLFHSLPN